MQGVKSGRKSHHLVDADLGIRGNTRKPSGEVHDVAFVGGRGRTQFVDSRTDFQHSLFDSELIFQIEHIDHLSDLRDGRLRITSKILGKCHVDLVRGLRESKQILLTGYPQLTTRTHKPK